MRYYRMIAFQPDTGDIMREWTSHPNGKFDPHALDLEVDVFSGPYAEPTGASSITLHGPALQDLGQAYSWGLTSDQQTGATKPGWGLAFYGGMGPGLPMANPKQAGLILAGQIVQSWGNWEGTEMTLEFKVSASVYTLADPGPFVLNWPAGRELGDALKECLQLAYPGMTVSMNIGTGYLQLHDDTAIFSTLDQLARWVAQLTAGRFRKRVDIGIQGLTIYVIDPSYQPPPVRIDYTDMIGQPTWIGPGLMQVKCVMRADIAWGSRIEMPKGMQDNPGIVLAAASALPSSIRYKSAFSGPFKVTALRHVGRYRSADGASWVTIINAMPLAPITGKASS